MNQWTVPAITGVAGMLVVLIGHVLKAYTEHRMMRLDENAYEYDAPYTGVTQPLHLPKDWK
jgi:hypothetical protein